jgi:hypothetical protein
MGADQGDETAGNLSRCDIPEVSLDLGGQGSAVTGIPRPRDGGPATGHHL